MKYPISRKNGCVSSSLAAVTSAALSAGLLHTSPVLAQADGSAYEEVVVTARKRDEKLLEIPLSMTAISASDIEDKGITELVDLVAFTPGFFFAEHSVGRADRSNRILVIRGMAISQENDHQQAATIFVDGIPALGSAMAGLEDLERVEVIRGPQSAYFGRSTFAGAVNFVTKTPSDTFNGRVYGEFGRFGTKDFGAQIEGPISDSLRYRLAASQQSTDGQYDLNNGSGITLGERETTSFSGTLYWAPSSSFDAKLRYHTFEDDDGPGAAFAYGLGNGEDRFNCALPNSSLAPRNGPNNWICGVAPFPSGGEIQGDFSLTEDKANLLNGISSLNLDSIFQPPILDDFGFKREAEQASLVMNYRFDSGITLSSLTGYHTNDWMALDDLDRRYSVIDSANDTALVNSRELEDFSQEIRLTSDQSDRLRWMLGGSYSHYEGTRTSGFRVLNLVLSFSLGNIFDIKTTGVFGAVEYDITDTLTLSLEGRYQEDDIEEARTSGAESVSGTFDSFTPRVILDWQFSDNATAYFSYGEGNRPGSFNVNLIGKDQTVLDQLAGIGLGLEVDEEELTNFEIGLKSSLLDGRAWLAGAIYWGDWDAQSIAGTTVTNPDGSTDFVAGNVVGGEIELSGIELEGAWRITDNFRLEGTFSRNESEIIKNPSCGDCGPLLGNTDISGLGKQLQRNPEMQASLSAVLSGALGSSRGWFARADYIHTGSKYATDANITETGDSNRLNLRAGLETDTYRVEVYGNNVTDDQTFTNYQFLIDFAYINPGANRLLTAGLPNKPTYGVRATYNF